jgi:HlyD family secretion protein
MKPIAIVCSLFLTLILGVALYLYFLRTHPSSDIVLFGNVDVRQVDIGFRVKGRVASLLFEEGDFVPAGQLMATLDKQPYEDQARQAKATLEATKVNLQNAETLLKRRQELIGDGSVSQEDLENTMTNRNVLLANLAESEAAFAVSKTNLDFTEVYSPTDGIILTRIREPGSVVLESEPVYTLSVISPVWVRAFIPEVYLGVVYQGMAADVFTDTQGGKIYKGRVGFISPVAEFTPKTVETTQLRTDLVYRLRIYVDNPDFGLRQGMPVTIKLYPQDQKSKEKK